MANVVEWQLKVSQAGANQAAQAIDKIAAAAGGAVGDVGKLGDATERAADAAIKAAGAYRDAGGRLREANGRFVKGGVEGLLAAQAAAAKLADTVDGAQRVGPVLGDGDIPKPAMVRSLSSEFDKLQASLGGANANAVLWAQSIKRGADNLKAIRAASRASAGATDAEKMIGGATPAHLKQAQDLSLTQRAVRRVLQELNASTGGAAFRGIARVSDGFDKLRPAMGLVRDVGSDLAPVFGKIGGAASSVLGILGPLTAAALAAGGAFAAMTAGAAFGGAKLVSSVVKAQAQREDLTRGLSIQLKSSAAGWDTLQRAARTADMIGESRVETAGQFNDLLAKGFTVDRVDELVRRMADMKVVDPKADMAGITRAIGQIAGTGRLQGDELNQLAENGLETGAVYDALAKRLGKTRAEIIKLKEAGKIDSDTAIQGIMDAIATQTGGKAAGVVAGEASKGLSGTMKRLENFWENLTFSMDAREGLGAVRTSLGAINDLLDLNTESGAKFATAIEGTFNALAAGFVEGFGGKAADGPEALRQNIQKVLDGIIAAKPDIKEFAAALGKAADAGVRLAGAFGESGAIGKAFKVMGVGVNAGLLAGETVSNQATTIGNVGRVLEGKPPEALASEQRSAYTPVGAAIVDGIVTGIFGNSYQLLQAMTSLTNIGIDAFTTQNKIHSPSKLYEELGGYLPMGLERGIVANSNGIFDAMLAAPDLQPPDLGAITGGAAAAIGLVGGRGAISVGDIYVDARGAQEPERVAELVREELLRTMESMGLATGAAA
jgi:tape measure domain-containing protein